MEVMKCDICGSYVDKDPEEMPRIYYTYNHSRRNSVHGDWNAKQVCYECYSKFMDVVEPKRCETCKYSAKHGTEEPCKSCGPVSKGCKNWEAKDEADKD